MNAALVLEVHEAVEQSQECESSCCEWLGTAPVQWRPKHQKDSAANSGTEEAIESPRTLIFYQDIWVAIAHYYLRSFRIQLHETMIRALQTLSNARPPTEDVSPSIEHYQKAGQDLIEENMLSVPFFLGQVDSCGNTVQDWRPVDLGLFHASVALKMIVQSALASEAQKRKAQGMMASVLQITGREITGQ